MSRAQHDDEWILKQDHALGCATFVGEREQHDVKLALVQSVKQTSSQVLRQITLEAVVSLAQPRQCPRQQERTDGWNNSHPHRARERLAGRSSIASKLFNSVNDPPCPLYS